jgi:hypothetical protein
VDKGNESSNASGYSARAATHGRVAAPVIAWLEILSGVIGCISLGWYYVANKDSFPSGQLYLRLGPFAAMTTLGFALLRRTSTGFLGSLLLQAAQVIALSVGGVTYRFCAGPFLALTFFSQNTSIYAGWDSSIAWGNAGMGAQRFISVNLIAVILVYTLWRCRGAYAVASR